MILIKRLTPHKLLKDAFSIILLGLLLRLLIAPFTLNWDLLANMHLAAKMDFQTLTVFYNDPMANYPPLMYKTLSLFDQIIHKVAPGGLYTWFESGNLSAITSYYVFHIIFLLKLPFIVIDLACGILFSKLFDPKKRNLALLFWMVNPVLLYIVAAWTNVDIITLFFIILNFYFFSNNRPVLSALSLGMAISYKLFPIFFFPFLVFSTVSWKKRILYALTVAFPVIFSHLPVLGISYYFSRLLSEGHSRSVLFATLPIGSDRALIYFYFVYFIVFFHYLSGKKNYFIYSFISILPIFILSKFNLQWLIWLMPFILYAQVKLGKASGGVILLYVSYFSLVIFSQASLNIGMLAPFDPTFWNLEWPLKKILGEESIFSVLNFFQTLFAASLVWLGYSVYKYHEKT